MILLVLMLVVFIGVLSWIIKEQSKPVVNPFDCISVSFHGKDEGVHGGWAGPLSE